MSVQHSVLNVKALVGTFNQEKALVGAFSVIVQPVVEPMDHFTALVCTLQCIVVQCGPSWIKLNCQTEGQRVDFVWEMSTKVPCSDVKQFKNVLFNPESHCILFTQRTNSLKQRIQRERQRWRMRRRSRSQCFQTQLTDIPEYIPSSAFSGQIRSNQCYSSYIGLAAKFQSTI